MTIEQIKVRARIEIGDLSVATPYVQSFSVRKQRGQVSTFDASLKVSHDDITGTLTGGTVKIYAGQDTASKIIFTGICRAAKVSPCYDDPKYVILSISGADCLSLLQGKKYTRRCRSSRSTWVAITGVVREGLKSGKFAYTNEPTITIDGGKLEKEQNVTAHIGTGPTDNVKPIEVNDTDNKESVEFITTLLNEVPTPL